MIPPMLLQPFCENAIWHGLMHKEGRERLKYCNEYSKMNNSIAPLQIMDSEEKKLLN